MERRSTSSARLEPIRPSQSEPQQEDPTIQAHEGTTRFADVIPISAATTHPIVIGEPAQAHPLWQICVKRGMDLSISIVGMLVLLLALPLVAAAIKINGLLIPSARGPIFYPHHRVGKDGKKIWFLKFRSMVTNAEALLPTLRGHSERPGPLFKMGKMKKDPRVTYVGDFLRKYSIDELPQFLHIFYGTMSFVGPRPHLPHEVATYTERQCKVLEVKPGLTGRAQVEGRADNTFEEEIEWDTLYVNTWSIWQDLWIIKRTFRVVLSGRGAR